MVRHRLTFLWPTSIELDKILKSKLPLARACKKNLIENKQSDSALKFSPIKTQKT